MIDDAILTEDDELEGAGDDVSYKPGDTADPPAIVEAKIPADIRAKYEVYSFRHAAVILSESRKAELDELLNALRLFTITKTMIRTAGGNESDIPKLLSGSLRPAGWHETIIQGDLLVKMLWKEQVGLRKGKAVFEKREKEIRRLKFIDGHKIDYVKNKVAFDLEWNSKDQTFDRDLYAFNAFSQCGLIDVGVLLTRSESLNAVFRALGPALKKDGSIDYKSPGVPRTTYEKYGASTTWMGKLMYRLNAGRNGACPVLAIGIKPACISDWSEKENVKQSRK